MLIGDVLNSGAIPSLEASLRYAGERHRLIAHNIANLSTPNFRPMDVAPATFQKALAKAIDQRRGSHGGMDGPLPFDSGKEIAFDDSGAMTLSPRTPSAGILYHDRNNRDLERLMQDHAENAGAYRIAADLLRSRFQQIREAIAERV